MVILELCTNVGSGFAPAHGRKFRGLSAFVIQCTREHDLVQSTSVLIDGVRRLRSRGCKTYVHFSPPCTGGSPMQYLQKDKLEERLSKYWKDFEKLLDCADRIFREAHTGDETSADPESAEEAQPSSQSDMDKSKEASV